LATQPSFLDIFGAGSVGSTLPESDHFSEIWSQEIDGFIPQIFQRSQWFHHEAAVGVPVSTRISYEKLRDEAGRDGTIVAWPAAGEDVGFVDSL